MTTLREDIMAALGGYIERKKCAAKAEAERGNFSLAARFRFESCAAQDLCFVLDEVLRKYDF